MVLRTVEHEVTYGPYRKVINVPADVCRQCGEQIFPEESQEEIRKVEEEMIVADQAGQEY